MNKIVKKRTSIKKRKYVKGGTVKKGTSKRTYKKEPSVKKGPPKKEEKKEDKKECPVCLEDITDDAITLNCNHTFHKTCMTGVCNMAQFDEENKCNCPMCRKLLTQEELDILGIKYPTREVAVRLTTRTPRQILDEYLDRIGYPPRLDTIEEFKEYINAKLEAEYSRSPSDVLMNVLEEFIGSDRMPSDLIGGIMEFRLKNHVFSFRNTYEFIKIVEEGSALDRWSKYFEFEFDEESMVTDVSEIR
jgi:hypothetical protein